MNVTIEEIGTPTLRLKVGKKVMELTDGEAKELQDLLNDKFSDRVPYRWYPYNQYVPAPLPRPHPYYWGVGGLICNGFGNLGQSGDIREHTLQAQLTAQNI